MKKPYIYLDWNCFNHIKNHPDDEFSEIIKLLISTNSYLIPYSFAHLSDLQKNLSEATLPYIESDLEFIKTLTSSYMIGMYQDDYVLSIQDVNLKFEEVRAFNKSQFNKINEMIDLQNINSNNLGTVVFSAFDRFNADPEPYKYLRNIISASQAPCKELEFFDELSEVPLSEEIFRKAVDKFLQLDDTFETTLCNKITKGYLLLEFNPCYREKERKINKNNSFSNIYTDSEHMKFASNASFYISKDAETRKKTQFVYRAYGIRTEVLNIEGFVNRFRIE